MREPPSKVPERPPRISAVPDAKRGLLVRSERSAPLVSCWRTGMLKVVRGRRCSSMGFRADEGPAAVCPLRCSATRPDFPAASAVMAQDDDFSPTRICGRRYRCYWETPGHVLED